MSVFQKSFQKASDLLQRPISATNLGLLRIGFGIVMILQLEKHFEWIDGGMFNSMFRIPFPYLTFIKPFPEVWMKVIVVVGIAAATLMAIGFLFRYATFVLAFCYGYFVFLNKTFYNNHYYLFFLLCVLLIFTHADRRLSVKEWWNKRKGQPIPGQVPYWEYFILQLQVFIVYFYGGIAKMNKDWMSGAVGKPAVEKLVIEPDAIIFWSKVIAWGGLAFDLIIGFLLFWPKTRLLALAGVLAFNLSNGLILFDDIGLFPYAMITVCFTIYTNKDTADRYLPKTLKTTSKISMPGRPPWAMKAVTGFFVIYFLFQFTFPFRHHFMPGHPEWTGQGHHFAWRMKSFTKFTVLKFFYIDRNTNQIISPVDQVQLNLQQMQILGFFPHSVWEFARRLNYETLKASGRPDIGVGAIYKASMNGKPLQDVIKPDTDLGKVWYHEWQKNDWITEWDDSDVDYNEILRKTFEMNPEEVMKEVVEKKREARKK